METHQEVIVLRRIDAQNWSTTNQCYEPSLKHTTHPVINICKTDGTVKWIPDKEGKEVELYQYNVVPGSGGNKIQWKRPAKNGDEHRYVLDLRTHKLEKRGNWVLQHYPFELYALDDK